MSGNQINQDSSLQAATLGGGCFWCLEAVYQELVGIHSVVSGYAGGHLANPTYEAVCQGGTGHAEVVQLQFDPSQITFREILEVFFVIHDPTTLNRQGNDIGTQYRSAIFYHTPEQQQIAEAVKVSVTADKLYPNPIETEVVPASTWYEAERYHQEYFVRNPLQGYCQFVVGPKVAKFRKQFVAKLKP